MQFCLSWCEMLACSSVYHGVCDKHVCILVGTPGADPGFLKGGSQSMVECKRKLYSTLQLFTLLF